MSSPKIFTFFIANGAGAALTGQVPTFETYKDDLGTNLAQPAISEIGGGFYKFTPVFSSNRGIAALINTDTGGNPQRVSVYMRPEDYNIDNLSVDVSTLATSASITALQADVTILRKVGVNKWAIITSGGDSNRLIIYDDDDVTPLYKFDLKDSAGTPTVVSPFSRTPL